MESSHVLTVFFLGHFWVFGGIGVSLPSFPSDRFLPKSDPENAGAKNRVFFGSPKTRFWDPPGRQYFGSFSCRKLFQNIFIQNILYFTKYKYILGVKRILLGDAWAMGGWAIGILFDPSLFAANAGRWSSQSISTEIDGWSLTEHG